MKILKEEIYLTKEKEKKIISTVNGEANSPPHLYVFSANRNLSGFTKEFSLKDSIRYIETSLAMKWREQDHRRQARIDIRNDGLDNKRGLN